MADQDERPRGWDRLSTHITSHKIEFGLWVTRILTIFFSFSYFFPFFGNPYDAYYKALMATGATSALRLHQRLPHVQFNREFLGVLMLEDSAHYLFYCLMFLYAGPITLVLLPILLFAVLHSASYSLTLLDHLGQNSWWGARMLISLVELQSRNMLRMVAFTEIFLMPLCVIMLFVGKASLLTPFVYYRFLGLRYSSRRNPYTRTMFYELRMALEQTTGSPRFPQGARAMTHKVINWISNMAPQV